MLHVTNTLYFLKCHALYGIYCLIEQRALEEVMVEQLAFLNLLSNY
jgi:hypothetical protein